MIASVEMVYQITFTLYWNNILRQYQA